MRRVLLAEVLLALLLLRGGAGTAIPQSPPVRSSTETGSHAGQWPQWRGPGSDGRTIERGLPTHWDAHTNVQWKARLPGPGHSSPIVWGDRIFLTAFREAGGLLSYFWTRGQLVVLALDARTGNIVWERPVHADRMEKIHSRNAPASPTPTTDGRFVYVHFGSAGLAAFDFDGRQVWEKPLGPYSNEWGSGSSPILYGTLLILNVDSDGEDFLLAVDKMTGKTVWRTSRSDVARGWSTPYVWRAADHADASGADRGRDEIVVAGGGHVKGYNPGDGRELWRAEGTFEWVAPTPVAGRRLLYVASKGSTLAIRPGGRGDVTRSHVVWHRRDGPYISSPVLVGEQLYTVEDGGVMTCVDADTGALVWRARLPARGNYFASLLAGDGKVYATSEDGDVTVVAAGPTFNRIRTNTLHERTMASPAIAGGVMYFRSDQHLFAIGQR